MTGKHAKAITESAGTDVRVHYSPELRRQFARLEAAVHDSDDFPSEMVWIIQDKADGKPSSVQNEILGIAAIVKETMEYIHKTGDKKAEEALEGIIDGLLAVNPNSPPVIMTAKGKRAGRGE